MILTTGKGVPFTVSDEDAPRVLAHRWHLTSCGYIATNIKTEDGYKHYRLHRWLLGVTDERIWVDHINGDPTDNRRENLRLCTRKQNAANQKPKGATSKFKGVSLSYPGRPRPWRATLRGKPLGSFATEYEAAFAYDVAARQAYGEFARLNEAELGVFG